jgi:hypothetical protein
LTAVEAAPESNIPTQKTIRQHSMKYANVMHQVAMIKEKSDSASLDQG